MDDIKAAPQKKRLLNLLIDLLCLNIVVFIVGMLMGAFGLLHILEKESTVIGAFLYLFYYLISELIWNRSPGKFFTKTRVILQDGGRPQFRDIFIRSVCRFIPFEAVSYLFSKNPIGWHDRFSDTVVIYEGEAVDE
ncbi:MAG: RDD family protein [Candidatus Omnitrophota bacterium]